MLIRRAARALCMAALVCASGVLAGCGADVPTAKVSGKITLVGKPPGDGLVINFVGSTGQTVGGPINADGTYQVDKVPVGEVQVGFSYSPPGQETSAPAGGRPDPDKKGRPKVKDAKAKLPFAERFQDPRTSGAATTVKANEENTFNFDLQKQ